MVTRNERQKECLKRWIKTGGAGTIVAATGFGKTNTALQLIDAFVKRNENASILVVVPTQILKDQWIDQLEERNLIYNTRVEIVNSVIRKQWTCELLVIDEVHLYASATFSETFNCVSYKNILCLTGTFERLDGKEKIIQKYAPVCDTITINEAEENGWVAPHKEYLVLLDVDLTDYNEWSRKFNGCFAYFNYDFSIAMNCATDAIFRNKYAKKMGLDAKQVAATANQWNTYMRKRKEFIQNHPKKLEIAKKILESRKDKKAITFSATIKQAESFGNGYVMHSKKKLKENQQVIESFNNDKTGVMHTSKAADQGLNVLGVNLEIILHTDSSKIRKTQRIGRAIRFEEGKEAEIFTLVLKGTQEVTWFNNSNTSKVITINEKQLDDILEGKKIQTRERDKVENLKFRF